MRSKKCLILIAPHLGSTVVGRVVYHSMAAAAGAAVDVSAVFAVTLAAYQQQQQRSMAVWNLIMDGYDDDTELDAEVSPRVRSKGAVSISAKTIKDLVGGKSYRTKTCRITPAGLPGAFAMTFAYRTVSSRSWWRW